MLSVWLFDPVIFSPQNFDISIVPDFPSFKFIFKHILMIFHLNVPSAGSFDNTGFNPLFKEIFIALLANSNIKMFCQVQSLCWFVFITLVSERIISSNRSPLSCLPTVCQHARPGLWSSLGWAYRCRTRRHLVGLNGSAEKKNPLLPHLVMDVHTHTEKAYHLVLFPGAWTLFVSYHNPLISLCSENQPYRVFLNTIFSHYLEMCRCRSLVSFYISLHGTIFIYLFL